MSVFSFSNRAISCLNFSLQSKQVQVEAAIVEPQSNRSAGVLGAQLPFLGPFLLVVFLLWWHLPAGEAGQRQARTLLVMLNVLLLQSMVRLNKTLVLHRAVGAELMDRYGYILVVGATDRPH